MAPILIHLLIIAAALCSAARNVHEPQQYRRSIQESQGIQTGNLTDLPLGQIGYTQDTINSDIHNNPAQLVPLQTFINLARKDPRGPEAKRFLPDSLSSNTKTLAFSLSTSDGFIYTNYSRPALPSQLKSLQLTAEEAGKSDGSGGATGAYHDEEQRKVYRN